MAKGSYTQTLRTSSSGDPWHAWQVVEAELQRIPRALLRGHSQELWSIVYMPQASVAPFVALNTAPHCVWRINADASPIEASRLVQVGFVVRLEGHRLTADLEDELPDFEFAFESSGAIDATQWEARHTCRCAGVMTTFSRLLIAAYSRRERAS